MRVARASARVSNTQKNLFQTFHPLVQMQLTKRRKNSIFTFVIRLGGVAQLVERLNGIQEVRGSTPLISTKKGLSEHCCIKKRYSDSFYFTKRRDAMKCVLFSYIIHYPFLFAFRWGYRRISQRICQRHGKIARKHFIYKDRVRLDNEF